jgi:hypothetical protein
MSAVGSDHNLPTRLVRGLLLIGVVGVSILNALPSSPIFDSIFFYVDTFARGTPLYSPQLYFHLTTGVIAVLTALVGGIPAAVYERIRGLRQSTSVSLAIWLIAAGLIALPSLMSLFAEE